VSVSTVDPAFALHVLPQGGEEHDATRPTNADRLTRLAARSCATPIAIMVAMENGQPAFRSGTGFAPHEREGLVTLCAATLENPPRQPLIPARCAPGINFYRGVPLAGGDGVLLGVLAVMDRVPRSLDAAQEEDQDTLAGLIAAQLNLQQHALRTAGAEGHEEPRDSAAGTAGQQTEEDAQRLATRLGITLESITEGFYTLDPQWRFTYLNREGARLLRRPSKDLLGKSIWKEFPGAINTSFSEQVRAAVAGNYQVEFEALYAPLDKWFEIRAYPFPDGVAIYFRDISERRKAREQLMLLETSISRLNDIVLITEAVPSGKPGLRIIFVNNAFEQHTGYSPEEALGHSPRLLCGPLTQRSELERISAAFQKGEPVQAELITYKKNGRHFWMEVDIVPVADDAGVFFTHWVAVGRDITRRKVAESEIKHLAFYDPLTQLPNRQLLMDRLQKALTHNYRHPREAALMFIDLDNFKTLNDTMGHQKGDLLLQQVAKRLAACLEQPDTVARLGGDEFVVMLEDLGQDPRAAAAKAEAVGTRILAALSEPYNLAGYQHYSTCSIGITSFNQTLDNIGDLLKQADLAMYQAKMSGRNTICFFNPAMQAAVTASAALQSDLRQGLREKQFLLYYQPQVGRDGRMTGVEALLRWQHGARGLVQPSEFIPAAEEAGLILPLGQWALETACRQLAAWAHRPETAAFSVAVNVSVRQFRHPEFVDLVMAALKETKVSPHKLKLELTESLLAENMDVTITKMARLKKMGVTLSIDDFGMGYSSLSCLKRLPLDQLKIDKSFVEDILRDPNDAAIARTIIGLAQSLGLGVVAEGVETEAQRDFLSRHGCDCYQGYLFCKPLPIDELEAFIKTLRI
jgi:diguanylate cyclase (GGDEF)-like protein/PAS domain S-box-containing protein